MIWLATTVSNPLFTEDLLEYVAIRVMEVPEANASPRSWNKWKVAIWWLIEATKHVPRTVLEESVISTLSMG